VTLEWLYTTIDILLLFGLIGIYLDRFERLGFLGLASFGVAVAALSFIGGPDADPFGFSTYEQGAMTLAIALVGLSVAWFSRGEKPLGPAFCWFGSVVCVGVLGLLPLPQSYGLIGAGVLFGAGFAWAGYALLSGRGLAGGRA
jgi:drug/metabolite transporter (DMT)-like permease